MNDPQATLARRLVAEIDLVKLMRQLRPEWRHHRRRPRREGWAHSFRMPHDSYCEILMAIHADSDSARSAWELRKRMTEAPPTENGVEAGEEVAIWPPRRRRGGSLLFRRWNVVVWISARGRLTKTELVEISEGIDGALLEGSPGVAQGVPAVPRIRIETDVGVDLKRPLRRSSEELRIPISLEYEKEDKLTLFNADETVGRLRHIESDPGWGYVFFPSRPGRRECTIVALTETGVVSSATAWIDVED